MSFEDYLRALGYTVSMEDGELKVFGGPGGDDSNRVRDLSPLRDAFDQFNKTDSQGRSVFGTTAYNPNMSALGSTVNIGGKNYYRVGREVSPAELAPYGGNASSYLYDPQYGHLVDADIAGKIAQSMNGSDPLTNAPLIIASLFGGGAALSGLGAGGAVGAGAGAASGITPELAAWYAAAGYTPAEISAISSALGGAAGGLGGITMGNAPGIGEGSFMDLAGGSQSDLASWMQQMGYDPSQFSNLNAPIDSGGAIFGSGVNPGGLDSALGDTLANYTAGMGAYNPLTTGSGLGILDILKNIPGVGSLINGLGGSLGSALGNNAVGTGLGALLGYLSGRNQPTQTATTDVPDWLKPYYTQGLDAGLTQMNASKTLTPTEQQAIERMQAGLTAPNPGLEAANRAMTDTASGKYLDISTNPQWNDLATQIGERYNQNIRPAVDAQFSRANAMGVGNTAWQEYTNQNQTALGRGLATGAANIYGNERQNQMNAAGAMPGFQNQYLTGLGTASLGLGNYQRMQPWQGIMNYGQLLGNLRGPSTSTQSQSVNPWQSALGGGLAGYALSNLWK